MPRPKKDGKTVSFYLDKELLDRFDRFCDDTGRSKTGAIEWMMKNGFTVKIKARLTVCVNLTLTMDKMTYYMLLSVNQNIVRYSDTLKGGLP